MNIVYSSSDSYAFLTGISILSLLHNNQHCASITVYILDNQISLENKKKLTNLVEVQYKRQLRFVPMPDIARLTGRRIQTGRWNISTFGRLYMASALPSTEHKALNIDCDTIVEGSIEELWKTDMTGKVVGGVIECFNDRYRRNIGMQKGEDYLNGGLVLMNLDEIRQGGYEQRFSEYIARYGNSLAYLDQDVLNGVIESPKKMRLPLRYNIESICYYATYEQIRKIRRSNAFYTKEEWLSAVQKPAIIHFTTCFLDVYRPWFTENNHPLRDRFLYYRARSPWKDEPLWNINTQKDGQWKRWLLRHMPKGILCEAASIMHGVIVPERNHIRMTLEVRKNKNGISDFL